MTFQMILLFIIALLIFLSIWGFLIIIVKLIEYHWLKKKIIPSKYRKKLRVSIFIAIIILSAFETLTAFYPLNGFYKSEFELNTGINFPASGKIVRKDSWYPDFQGDYWAAAVFEVSETDYSDILNQLKKSEDFKIDTTRQGIGITVDFRELMKNYKEEDFVITFTKIKKEWFKVAFLKDRKTIVFERS